MIIPDDFTLDDPVSGLKIRVQKGEAFDALHIEFASEPMTNNRDIFFTKTGEFDGCGTSLV